MHGRLQGVQGLCGLSQCSFRRRSTGASWKQVTVDKEAMVNMQGFAPGAAVSAAELARSGLLLAGEASHISSYALFMPADEQGTVRPVEVGAGCSIGAYAVICGGTILKAGACVEEHALVGRPERGYAVGHVYPGTGASTVLGREAIVRSGAVIYAGVTIGAGTSVGHHTLLRSFATVGQDSQLGHHLTVERASRIGAQVRCSSGSHITSSCVLADRVFLGAGVRTVNDRELIWRDPAREPQLVPPRFERGARVGSGSVILAGVTVGEDALVGAGSVVTRDIPAGSVAYGVPARVRRSARAGRP
jgi:acetyltransferase-like isoleucine patch superfamily enzyme